MLRSSAKLPDVMQVGVVRSPVGPAYEQEVVFKVWAHFAPLFFPKTEMENSALFLLAHEIRAAYVMDFFTELAKPCKAGDVGNFVGRTGEKVPLDQVGAPVWSLKYCRRRVRHFPGTPCKNCSPCVPGSGSILQDDVRWAPATCL